MGVFSLQARFWTLAMIANTYDGGLRAAGAVCPNDAMDNDKGVPKEQFKDRSNHGASQLTKYLSLIRIRRRAGPHLYLPP